MYPAGKVCIIYDKMSHRQEFNTKGGYFHTAEVTCLDIYLPQDLVVTGQLQGECFLLLPYKLTHIFFVFVNQCIQVIQY